MRSRNKVIKKILNSNLSFRQILKRLKVGRKYIKDVKKGRILESMKKVRGKGHHYAFHIPETYDPSYRYPVVFYLHGGIGRKHIKISGRWWRNEEAIINGSEISVFPQSWHRSLWWQNSQVKNLSSIFKRIKNEYNIDENRGFLIWSIRWRHWWILSNYAKKHQMGCTHFLNRTSWCSLWSSQLKRKFI